MGVAKAQMFCPQEQRLVLAERQTANHILHLLLSLVTVGFWIPVWLLLTIFSGPYRCPHCGARTKAKWYPSQVRAEPR
jgi:hypothetical protein